jgi:hypothetical protein
MMISKIELKCFQINLMLELLGLLLNFYSLRVSSFFQFFYLDILKSFFCCLDSSLNLHFSSNKNSQIKKIQNQKNTLVGRKGVKFQQIKLFLLLQRKKNVKYILTSLHFIYVVNFFLSCLINYWY